MGCVGIRVEDPNQVQSAIQEALESNKPAVIDVISDIDGIAERAWTP